MNLICPICSQPLNREAKALRCPAGHAFDVARQGYVHLLPVQQKHSLHPGDTREQVLSRRSFLETGAYKPIVDAVCDALLRHNAGTEILDVGCGEGYYGVQAASAVNGHLTGLDISKEAVRCAAAKYKNAAWICGTAAHLPVADGSADVVMSMFALTVPGEFHRVLKERGLFIQVLAAQDHLMGLKKIIYPEILLKEKDSVPVIEGFSLVESIPVKFEFTAEGEQIGNLLSMTPHFWRISAQGARRLEQVTALTDRASCVVNVYRRED